MSWPTISRVWEASVTNASDLASSKFPLARNGEDDPRYFTLLCNLSEEAVLNWQSAPNQHGTVLNLVFSSTRETVLWVGDEER